jgi:purine-binding chemotaxis protein CheW
VAVISDGLEGLVVIPRRNLEPSPAESTGMAEFLSGVARDKIGTIAVLDLPRLVEAARARAVPYGSGAT